jgi:hypothetical protein
MQSILEGKSLRQSWDDCRPSKAQAFWIAAGCVVATLILGFGPGGWVTGGTAQKMVSEAADKSRRELATAVCVEEFMGAADAGARLEKLKKAIWYERDEQVAAGGWATMPDRQEPNSMVAAVCASRLVELEAPAAAKAAPAAAEQAGTTAA